MRTTLKTMVVAAAAVIGMQAALPGVAFAAATEAQRVAQATAWSQATTASRQSWDAGRQNQGAWADYGFDWSTDYCSTSPDKPLGFDFKLSCHRHDFGYRNFKALGIFDANKDRIDNAFLADLRAVCDGYSGLQRSTCRGLANTYYEAVRVFGFTAVSEEQINEAAQTALAEFGLAS
ncbi:phospholipase [Actinoplanes utahensis]|uniref:Phospholipase A2 n=1 Tax=Actinoplanes utahensis TaxID=1869 RepID=A0A0A6UBD4_ACTUT|nr:phospholipase [Actinoplanes utahensis]KHD73335.1 hypothetical protein MB27_34395 [Actinoplanes utahensis]GIF30072.1 hypothetical protein Aut01nite_30580 [Actinoplanes utahensis]